MHAIIVGAALCLLAGSAYAGAESFDCAYQARGAQEVGQHRNCGVRADGSITVSAQTIQRLRFDRHGLASIAVGRQHYYVKRDGTVLPVITFDNGADDFAEGLTRSLIHGKMAYYDRSFKQVIGPTYDWGWPFNNGRALVCTGCSRLPPDSDGHTAFGGGLWGYINRKGEEIVPVALTRSEAEKK
jgi:hypothetical protein